MTIPDVGLTMPKPPPWMTMEQYRHAAMAGMLPDYRPHHDPIAPPLGIGDFVSKYVRPSDLAQEWKVVGLRFFFYGCGWKATIIRVNRKAGVEDGEWKYFMATHSLYVIEKANPHP